MANRHTTFVYAPPPAKRPLWPRLAEAGIYFIGALTVWALALGVVLALAGVLNHG